MRVIVVYALLALIVIPIFPHFPSPNEFSHWLLDASIVERGTIEVTALAPLLGPRFEDLSVVDGRAYSNKAPGTNLLSLPGYALARCVTTALRAQVTAERWTASTLPLLALALLFIRLARRWNIDSRRCTAVVWILLFATPLFAYGLLLFSHALVAAALFGAWYALHEERCDVLGGALVGLAVAAEYPIAIPALIVVAPLLATKRIVRIVAGGLPFAALVALYNTAAFGGPLRNPYAFSRVQEYRQLAEGGLLGIRVPSPVNLVKLLADPTYGLLVFAPVLLLAIPAFSIARSRLRSAAWWTLLLAPLSIIVLYSGYPYWHGGWNVGPRYLMPAVPFLVAPLFFGSAPRIEALLGGASSLAIALTTLAFPFVPEAFAFPWMSLAAPLLGSGLAAPNLFHLVSRPLALAIPLTLVVLACAVAMRGNVGYALIGALLAIVIGFRAPSPLQALQRMYIADVYFDRPGSLPEHAPRSYLRRRDAERQLPPPTWPF